MAYIIDSYSEANASSSVSENSSWITLLSQSFTGDGGKLSHCVYSMKKNGTVTGNAVVKIYAHSGTFGTSSLPTGTALATSDTLDVSELPTDYELVEITFSGDNKITLESGVKYCLVCEYSGGDSGNYIVFQHDASSPTHDGNMATYSGSWYYYNEDLCFYVYGDDLSINKSESVTVTETKYVVPLLEGGAEPNIVSSFLPPAYSGLAQTNSGGVGQSFIGDGGTLNSATFQIYKSAGVTGTLNVCIYEHTGEYGISSKGTGTPLATSENIDIATQVGTSWSFINFVFSGANKIELSDGTPYVVAVILQGDVSGYISVAHRYAQRAYHAGNETFLSAGGSWSSYIANDVVFVVYKDSSYDITVYDSSTSVENQVVEAEQALEISVSDSSTLGESTSVSVISPIDLLINKSDGVVLDSSNNISVSAPPFLEVNKSENVSIEESLGFSMSAPPDSTISKSDSISINDSPQASIEEPDMNLDASFVWKRGVKIY